MNRTHVVAAVSAIGLARRWHIVAAWVVVCIIAATSTASAAPPVYNIVPLGLDDLEHTRDDGYKESSTYDWLTNDAGQVSGYSYRYNGGNTFLGTSAWLYNGTTTVKIGLTGPEHTASSGLKQIANISPPNEVGQVSGESYRYNGGTTDLGQSAWIYDGTTTIDIGLVGIEHTRFDGYKYSNFAWRNEAGHVSGYSLRYNGGGNDLGRSAWLYDGATTIDIGLTGPDYTRFDGYKASFIREMNEAGQVAGVSDGGFFNADLSAWLHNGASTIDIGLVGSEYRVSDIHELNEAGQVSGQSYRRNGNTPWGRSAWLYDGATTIDIGLTGPEHTRNDGYKLSSTSLGSLFGKLFEAGQVAGYAERYNGGSNSLGWSAWLYDGVTTIDIGLTGPEHTRDDGLKSSEVWDLNEAGQVSGGVLSLQRRQHRTGPRRLAL